MDRNEYLATEVMQWVKKKTFSGKWKWFDSHGWAVMALNDWNPGESWPQIGMLLKQMEEDFYITVQQYNDRVSSGYDVTFRKWESDDYGNGMEIDFREAIATAAARAKGWVE